MEISDSQHTCTAFAPPLLPALASDCDSDNSIKTTSLDWKTLPIKQLFLPESFKTLHGGNVLKPVGLQIKQGQTQHIWNFYSLQPPKMGKPSVYNIEIIHIPADSSTSEDVPPLS